MPTTNRQNAPTRLPSADLENSFFRAWALRGSEGSNATERSQAASSASSPSSPVSPLTPVPDRKTRSVERRKYFSDTNIPLRSPPVRGPSIPYFEPSYSPPIIVHEDPSFLKTRASTTTTFSNKNNSSRSSVSSPVGRRFGISNLRVAPNAAKDGWQTREARKGFRYKHETSDHWIDIRIGRKKMSRTSQAGSEGTTRLVQAPKIETPTAYDEGNDMLVMESSSPPTSRPLTPVTSNPRSWTERTPKNDSADALLSPSHLKEGLYCRTKRVLGLKHGPIAGTESGKPVPERVMTGEVGEVLQKASNALRHFAVNKREPTSASTSTSNLSIAAPGAAHRWQRLRPGFPNSTRTSFSSLRSMLRGKTPPPSPEPQSMYTGSDKNQYLTVELTDPDAPTFLPSEARRIKTPPLGTSELGSRKLRGFFFEYNLSSDIETPYSMSSDSTGPFTSRPAGDQQDSVITPRRISATEWYRLKLNAIESDDDLSREQFVLRVPEHLPNSPMCPRHPKNKSGGKGVCVYHGRSPSWGSQIPSSGASQISSAGLAPEREVEAWAGPRRAVVDPDRLSS